NSELRLSGNFHGNRRLLRRCQDIGLHKTLSYLLAMTSSSGITPNPSHFGSITIQRFDKILARVSVSTESIRFGHLKFPIPFVQLLRSRTGVLALCPRVLPGVTQI